ncbi:MAG: peptidylprolyl isomerase [Paracoccaceae bacterium]
MRPSVFRILASVLLAAWACAVPSGPGSAQSLFSAAIYVNDDAITNYEIDQKVRLLQFLGIGAEDMRAVAIERLIEERLQAQEVGRLGGRLTPDQLDTGLAEFAARAELTTDQLFDRLASAGIDREGFISFIRAGLLWRELVRERFGPRVVISESQIDHALSVEGVQPATEILISELFLPSDAQFAESVQRLIPQILRLRSETEFANAARQVSIAPTAAQGGRVDRWINVASMPEALAGALGSAGVGSIVGPVEVPGAHAFFLLRARRDSRSVPASAIMLDYRRIGLPGGRSEANLATVATMREQIDGCADFAPVALRLAPGLPDSAVSAISRPLTEVPGGTRTELERLNPGQISANLVESGELVVLMLCSRSATGGQAPSRDDVRLGLMNRALEGEANLYLARLRAEAEIRYP